MGAGERDILEVELVASRKAVQDSAEAIARRRGVIKGQFALCASREMHVLVAVRPEFDLARAADRNNAVSIKAACHIKVSLAGAENAIAQKRTHDCEAACVRRFKKTRVVSLVAPRIDR